MKLRIVQSREATRLRTAAEIPEWWAGLSDGEKKVIQAVASVLRSAKRSQHREVALAAAKWERGIGCFVKVRLIHSYRRGTDSRLPLRQRASVTSSPSNVRNPRGAAPNLD